MMKILIYFYLFPDNFSYQFDTNDISGIVYGDQHPNISLGHNPSFEFVYTSRGHLVIDGYTFSRTAQDGRSNTVYWRCSAFKKHQCKVSLKTKEKQVTFIRGVPHTHDAPQVLREVQPLPWTDSLI